jgi:hypothetical protein
VPSQYKPVPPGFIKQGRSKVVSFQPTDEFRRETAGFAWGLGSSEFPDILQDPEVFLLDATSGKADKKGQTSVRGNKGRKNGRHVAEEGEIKGGGKKEKDHICDDTAPGCLEGGDEGEDGYGTGKKYTFQREGASKKHCPKKKQPEGSRPGKVSRQHITFMEMLNYP